MQFRETMQLAQRATRRLFQAAVTDRANLAMIAMALLILLLGSYAIFG